MLQQGANSQHIALLQSTSGDYILETVQDLSYTAVVLIQLRSNQMEAHYADLCDLSLFLSLTNTRERTEHNKTKRLQLS